MENSEAPPPRSSSLLTIVVQLWLGLLAYGGLNLLALIAASSVNIDPATAIIVVGSVAAIAAALLGRLMFAAGLLVGYAVLTIASGGACTGWNMNGPDALGQMITGLILYVLALILYAVGMAVLSIVQSRRGR
jgi:hypothetical protein